MLPFLYLVIRSIIPEKLSLNSFSAAYISQSLDLDFLIYERYKEELLNLKFLVINISYPSLFSSLASSKENWRLKNYNIYYKFSITSNLKNYSELFSNKYSVNRQRMVQYYKNNLNPVKCTTLGNEIKIKNDDLFETAIKASRRHTKENLPYYKEYLKHLNKIINYTNEKEIKIILITPPAFKGYIELLNKKQLHLMTSLIDSIANLNKNVYRLDMLRDENYKKDDFADADHLNYIGAEKLTLDINNYIESLLD